MPQKSKSKAAEKKDEGPSLETLIERERQKIGVGTPVNAVTFAAWMRRKRVSWRVQCNQSENIFFPNVARSEPRRESSRKKTHSASRR